MRASIVIAAHNEGEALWKTIRSCVETCSGLDYEIVVADDASTDDSIAEAERRFPSIRVVRQEQRQGASPAKDLGARQAEGGVLVFLDGHCNPEPGAIVRLVEDVEQVGASAIVTPTIPALDVAQWRNIPSQTGEGYFLDLEKFDCGWLPLGELRGVNVGRRRFYESPALIGCALAVSRVLYDDLRGFDRDMRMWGVEDLDFGLKCWLMGHRILHDPEAVIGHRFRAKFDNYDVPMEHFLVNQLRMAWKNFTRGVWSDWVDRARQRHAGRLVDHPEGLWAHVWQLFTAGRATADEERAHLHAKRPRDEFWYAERFGLTYPRLHSAPLVAVPGWFQAMASPSPSPSPGPCGCRILRDGQPITDANRNVLVGEQVNLSLDCAGYGNVSNITWYVPGKPFKDFKGTKTTGTLTPLADADRHAASVTFYCAAAAQPGGVSVRFKLNGKLCEENATLNVKKPTWTFTTTQGSTKFNDNKTCVGLYPDAGQSEGMNYTGKVTVPAGFEQGRWHFVQLVKPGRQRKLQDGTCTQVNTQGKWVLDTTYPYEPEPYDPDPGSPGSYPTGNQPRTEGDSPDADLFVDPPCVQLNAGDSFRTYIMFKPAGANSKWVPVCVMAWFWMSCSTYDGTTWTLVEKGQGKSAAQQTSDHPTWNQNCDPPSYVPGKCPPPCGSK